MDFQNYLAYADINKQTIKEAWNSKTITELRKKHLLNNVKNTICDNCINGTFSDVQPLEEKLATKFCEYKFTLPQELRERKV